METQALQSSLNVASNVEPNTQPNVNMWAGSAYSPWTACESNLTNLYHVQLNMSRLPTWYLYIKMASTSWQFQLKAVGMDDRSCTDWVFISTVQVCIYMGIITWNALACRQDLFNIRCAGQKSVFGFITQECINRGRFIQ